MTNYLKVGTGPTIVMLHGWGDSSLTFSKLAGHLQNKYELLMLDLPGFGGTQGPPNAWGLVDYAYFVKAWMDKLGIKATAIVGHSYGGAVAITLLGQELAAKKLVLIASAGIRDKKPAQKKALSLAAKAGKLPLFLLPAGKRRYVKQKFYKAIGSDALLLPGMELTYKRIINEDVQAAAAKIKIPTLLIYGSLDKSTPVVDGHTLNRIIRGSRMELVVAGHFLHQEQDEKVSILISNFLGNK